MPEVDPRLVRILRAGAREFRGFCRDAMHGAISIKDIPGTAKRYFEKLPRIRTTDIARSLMMLPADHPTRRQCDAGGGLTDSPT
jgi:hypothetical protein